MPATITCLFFWHLTLVIVLILSQPLQNEALQSKSCIIYSLSTSCNEPAAGTPCSTKRWRQLPHLTYIFLHFSTHSSHPSVPCCLLYLGADISQFFIFIIIHYHCLLYVLGARHAHHPPPRRLRQEEGIQRSINYYHLHRHL